MKMTKCLSFTASRDRCFRQAFSSAGLRPSSIDLGNGTIMHYWAPRYPSPHKPSLLLIHGFGANAMWQWSDQIRPVFLSRFNIYVPDLLFFGDSFTTRPERSDSFQAQCVMAVMESVGVRQMSVVGISYGGFVAYSMAAQFKEVVERVVICCSGVCLEERDLTGGLFRVSNLEEAASILMPQTPEKLRELVSLSFYKPPPLAPSCFLADFIDVMCTEYVKEKKELLQAIVKDRKHSDLSKITQPTLILWGDKDQIFPVELGHRLKRHLGDNAQLVIIKKAGHAINAEKPKEFTKHLKAFLNYSLSPVSNKKLD